ncbi:MAG: anthranilate phosphoribosyltransferase [Bacteroidales bacterium]|nr:anthranilate phosphoribosyltransferase [Bacteroidales bacterium]
MKKILNQLFDHQQLTEEDAYQVLTGIGKGQYNPSQVASFLTVYLMRQISVDELRGFRNALLDLCLKVDLSGFDTIDVCGTGGDGKDTFNISTLSAFVVSGAGYKVAKHGNYGVSSACGSSNVMEYLGYQFTNDESVLKQQLETAGFCMMHAPLFHPAMKNVGPIRRELAVKTFFNMLGPLVNPSFPSSQMVGVYSLEVARLYYYLFQDMEDFRFDIIHSLDGYDEISLTGDVASYSRKGEQLLTPSDWGLDQVKVEEIFGGKTVEEAAGIFVSVLKNEATVQQMNVVLANSASAIRVLEPEKSMEECVSIARESLASGRALESLKKITNLS